MGGQPVWLASMTRRKPSGEIIPTDRWNPTQFREAEKILDAVLDGVGDPTRERCFRMCATFCRHRAVSDEEIAQLPTSWDDTPPEHLAGPPLEVLWEKGGNDPLSTKPCRNATKVRMPGAPYGSKLFLLKECNDCDTCRARAETAAKAMANWKARKGIR